MQFLVETTGIADGLAVSGVPPPKCGGSGLTVSTDLASFLWCTLHKGNDREAGTTKAGLEIDN